MIPYKIEIKVIMWKELRPRIKSSQNTVIVILSPDNLENAMVKGHFDQGIKANELWVMVWFRNIFKFFSS